MVEGDDLPPLDRASQIGLEAQRGDRALVHVAGEDLVAGATAHLGPVHRRVGVPQHVLGALIARARQRDADAHAGEHLDPLYLQRGSHLLVNSLGHARGVGLGADVVEQDGELITAEAGQRISRANAALEAARRRAQDLVTDLVAEAVIDRLEPIEIEVEHREPRIAQRASGAVKQVLQPVQEQRTVRKIGERIVERLVLKLLAGFLPLGDVARDPKGPHDVPLPIAQRELRRRHPAELTGRQRLLLLHVHQRLSGANDLLLVAQRLRSVLVGEEVEVGPADGERRAGDAEPRRLISVDPREAALEILEVDGVGDVVHQRLQQEGSVFTFRNLREDIARRLGVGRLGAGPQAHRDLVWAPSLRRPMP